MKISSLLSGGWGTELMDKIKNSLGTKIFLGIALILLAVSLLMFGILRFFMPRTYENELFAQVTANMQRLTSQMKNAPIDQWESMLAAFCAVNNTGVGVFDENGEQVAGFSVSVYTADKGVIEQKGDNFANALSVAFEQEGKFYSLVANVNVSAVSQMSGIFSKIFPYVLGFILIISILTAFFYSQFLAKPIINISNISKRMAALDMNWRCDASRSDEIGVLAGNLNEMALRLDSALCELQEANDKLKADIDREREQDKRRRDFFSAISHELKTPVTILKGELDGMLLNVGKFKDRDKYLQEAYQTTESIEKLVREIMTLARLDMIHLNMEEISMSHLADECCMIYKCIADNKHIQIDRQYNTDTTVKADKKQMMTVLSNIISNAVLHSPEGSHVNLCTFQKDNHAVLTVENTGIHIDPADISKVWEPFYRTDKSRNRDTGGSGLGLYIVKSILDLHGFWYWLENTDNGIKFTLVFPFSSVHV